MTPKKQHVLVTGGGGFLGKAIVKQLIASDTFAVKSFSRHMYQELESLGVEQIQGDIRDSNRVEHACKGIDLVFHVAAKTGMWGKYNDYYQTNVIGTKNILNACQMHNVSRLVYTSSPSVIFDGSDAKGIDESALYPKAYHSLYSKTKAIAEQAVIKASGSHLRTIILRPHLIWGPEDTNLVPRIIARAKQLVIIGNGDNLVDTLYIDNAADAHILAAAKLHENPDLSGKIFFISQDEPVYLWDMINNILKAGGHEPVKRKISKQVAFLAGALFELTFSILNIKKEPRITRFVAKELATSHWFDISAAKRDLGYVPKVSIQEGLIRLEAWLNTHQLIKTRKLR
jgi:nucleoside-diphosphate-sugar epimerase